MKTCVYTEETPRLKPGESKDTDILEAGDDIFEEMDKPDEYEIELIPKSTSQRPSLHRLAKVASHRRTSSTIDGRLARSTSMANRKSRLIVSPEPETMKLHPDGLLHSDTDAWQIDLLGRQQSYDTVQLPTHFIRSHDSVNEAEVSRDGSLDRSRRMAVDLTRKTFSPEQQMVDRSRHEYRASRRALELDRETEVPLELHSRPAMEMIRGSSLAELQPMSRMEEQEPRHAIDIERMDQLPLNLGTRAALELERDSVPVSIQVLAKSSSQAAPASLGKSAFRVMSSIPSGIRSSDSVKSEDLLNDQKQGVKLSKRHSQGFTQSNSQPKVFETVISGTTSNSNTSMEGHEEALLEHEQGSKSAKSSSLLQDVSRSKTFQRFTSKPSKRSVEETAKAAVARATTSSGYTAARRHSDTELDSGSFGSLILRQETERKLEEFRPTKSKDEGGTPSKTRMQNLMGQLRRRSSQISLSARWISSLDCSRCSREVAKACLGLEGAAAYVRRNSNAKGPNHMRIEVDISKTSVLGVTVEISESQHGTQIFIYVLNSDDVSNSYEAFQALAQGLTEHFNTVDPSVQSLPPL